MGDPRQKLAALAIALRARVSVALRFADEVHHIPIRLDDGPVWTIPTHRGFDLKPPWKFCKVAHFLMLVNFDCKLTFYLGIKGNKCFGTVDLFLYIKNPKPPKNTQTKKDRIAVHKKY